MFHPAITESPDPEQRVYCPNCLWFGTLAELRPWPDDDAICCLACGVPVRSNHVVPNYGTTRPIA